MGKTLSRRTFIKTGAVALGAVAASEFVGLGSVLASSEKASPVYFTRDISVNGLLNIYNKINANITGKTAIKLHTGEPNGPNLLPRELIMGLQAQIPDSTIVECNVLYNSPRQNTQGHLETLKINGWNFCPVDIMDANGETMLPIAGMAEFLESSKNKGLYTPGGHLTEVAVGKHFFNYDSMVVYTHFKGHAMGGFGGSLKNLSIGCASGGANGGKLQIHGEGWPTGPNFLERMVEAGKGMADHFGNRITYINVLKNISVDCDCDKNGVKPTCGDIGIVGSTDILAVDKASIDLVYAMPEKERHDMVERIESRSGLRQLAYMRIMEMGNHAYEVITI
ncbi:DUF362 domain-containing protein [Desulfosarcina sp. OttesenSCG-928-A07]|nr:DUF362 domain-containing protein [Desulfosarcina sp. OttesenSCG-928-A07]